MVDTRFLGEQYDMLFDITEDKKVSCVELVYKGIKSLPEWQTRFADLIKLIEEHDEDLTPQMLLDCDDMDVAFEVRR